MFYLRRQIWRCLSQPLSRKKIRIKKGHFLPILYLNKKNFNFYLAVLFSEVSDGAELLMPFSEVPGDSGIPFWGTASSAGL